MSEESSQMELDIRALPSRGRLDEWEDEVLDKISNWSSSGTLSRFIKFLLDRDDISAYFEFNGDIINDWVLITFRFHWITVKYKEIEAEFSMFGYKVFVSSTGRELWCDPVPPEDEDVYDGSLIYPHYSTSEGSMCVNSIHGFSRLWASERFGTILAQARHNLSSYNPHDSYNRLPPKHDCDVCGGDVSFQSTWQGFSTCRNRDCNSVMCGSCVIDFREGEGTDFDQCKYCTKILFCEEHRTTWHGMHFCNKHCAKEHRRYMAIEKLNRARRRERDKRTWQIVYTMDEALSRIENMTGKDLTRRKLIDRGTGMRRVRKHIYGLNLRYMGGRRRFNNIPF